jgi:DNA processing protein
VEGGDPAVTELVQSIGAETAWAKIIEGVLGEPAAQRAAAVPIDAVARLAKASAMRFVMPGDDEWPSGLDDLRHAESIQRRGGGSLATRTALWLKNWRKELGDSRFARLKALLRLR